MFGKQRCRESWSACVRSCLTSAHQPPVPIGASLWAGIRKPLTKNSVEARAVLLASHPPSISYAARTVHSVVTERYTQLPRFTSSTGESMGLTEEQAAAVDLFKTSSSLKISAFAGTGKTTTLTALGKSTKKSGLYLAFNKSIATEAQTKFPQTVDCRTTHSLALRSLPNSYRGNSAKLFDSLPGNRIAQILDIEEISIDDILLKPRATGFLTARTIQKFCQSGDDFISHKHVPLSGKLALLRPEHRLEFEKYLAELASHLWDRMVNPSDATPLGHDGYLKLWSLSSPPLPYDFILLDEAQDTNEAVLSVLRKQQSKRVAKSS